MSNLKTVKFFVIKVALVFFSLVQTKQPWVIRTSFINFFFEIINVTRILFKIFVFLQHDMNAFVKIQKQQTDDVLTLAKKIVF